MIAYHAQKCKTLNSKLHKYSASNNQLWNHTVILCDIHISIRQTCTNNVFSIRERILNRA